MLKIIYHHVLHWKSPLAHKTRKNTTKNWITIARAHKLSLFKSFKLSYYNEYKSYLSLNFTRLMTDEKSLLPTETIPFNYQYQRQLCMVC